MPTVTTEYEHLWQIGNPDDRERFTQAPRGQTEQLNFRVFTSHSRVLDEIIHSGIDPRLKTKSDCLQDAVALFIEDWNEKYPDGLSGRTLRKLMLEKIRMERESREEFLSTIEAEIESAKKQKDREGFVKILSYLKVERDDYRQYAPPSYIDQLTLLIKDLEELLS